MQTASHPVRAIQDHIKYGCVYRGKVLTLFTSLVINNLSAYKTPYTFLKVFTPLRFNNVNAYTIVNVRGFR